MSANNNLIVSESELSLAINKTERYATFLIESMGQYDDILTKIAGTYWKSEKAELQIQNLLTDVKIQKNALIDALEQLVTVIKKYIADIETIDNYRFDSISFREVLALFSDFTKG